ncbi:MAG: hypothetical protein V2A61_00015, partial [Calditrichota bacterium]
PGVDMSVGIEARCVKPAVKIRDNAEGLEICTDQGTYFIRWSDCAPAIRLATPSDRMSFYLNSAGRRVIWPALDISLSINSLIERAERLRK